MVTAGKIVRFEDYTDQRRARACRAILRRPDGRVGPGGDVVVYSALGPLLGILPTARDDPPGTWTLTVEDVTKRLDGGRLGDVKFPSGWDPVDGTVELVD